MPVSIFVVDLCFSIKPCGLCPCSNLVSFASRHDPKENAEPCFVRPCPYGHEVSSSTSHGPEAKELSTGLYDVTFPWYLNNES